METKVTPELRDAPIYQTFRELFAKGFTLDTATWVFVLAIHVAAIGLGAWVGLAAPQESASVALGWAAIHFVIGSMSTSRQLNWYPVVRCCLGNRLVFSVAGIHSW